MKALVHYYNVMGLTCFTQITPKNIRSYPSYLFEGAEAKWLYSRLNSVNKPSRFIECQTRLFIEAEHDQPSFLMDTEGNIRRGKEEYQLTPNAFLVINVMLMGKEEERQHHMLLRILGKKK